jgi:phosphoglycolate phosphatase
MTLKKLLLFDFDGVIVDSLDLYEDAVNRCLKEIGKPPFRDRDEFLRIFENNFYQGIREKGVDVAAFMEASAALAPALDYGRVKPVDELKPVLEKLQDRHTLAIVSSNSNYAIRRILSTHHYDRYFEDILGHEFTLSKTEKIGRAATLLKKGLDKTFYIGDTAGDIKEAKQAGARTVAITWGWHTREKLRETGPDFIFDRPEELLKL